MQSSTGGAVSSSKTSAQQKKWPIKWKGTCKIGKYFEKYISDKGLIYTWYKEFRRSTWKVIKRCWKTFKK